MIEAAKMMVVLFLIPVSCSLITDSVEKDMFMVLYVP